jgi:hypothetical protein
VSVAMSGTVAKQTIGFRRRVTEKGRSRSLSQSAVRNPLSVEIDATVRSGNAYSQQETFLLPPHPLFPPSS